MSELDVKRKLRQVVEKEKRGRGIKAVFSFLWMASVLILSGFILEAAGNFDVQTRTIIFFTDAGILLLLLLLFVVYPLLMDYKYYLTPDYIKTARSVGNYYPEIKDELANALQLIESGTNAYSKDLISAAFKRVYLKIDKLDLTEIIDFRQVKKSVQTSAIITISCLVIFFAVPGLLASSYRLINFNRSFAPPARFYFEILPGNISVTKGDNVSIRIRSIGEKPSEVFLLTKAEDQSEFTAHKLTADSTGEYAYLFHGIKNSIEYYASAEKISSKAFSITVVNRPIVTGLELTVQPPTYTRLPNITQTENGNVTLLQGSRLKVAINSSLELSGSTLKFGDNSSNEMKISGARAYTEFQVMKETAYQPILKDSRGVNNSDPITYTIKMTVDQPPSIEMIKPVEDTKLEADGKLSIIARISDDFGFSKMNLNYKLSNSKYRKIGDDYSQLPVKLSAALLQEEVYYVWDLTSLIPAEGESFSYYLEVFDNNTVTGPKSARSPVLTITVPSLNSIMAEADHKEQDAVKDLSQTLKDAEKLNQEFQKISDQLKQNTKEISWQEKENIEKAAEKIKNIEKKIESIAQKLEEAKNELAKNNVLSDETMKKFSELRELIDKMNSEEMKEALKRLNDSLQSLQRNDVQMSLEEMKANEEYLKKSIERTLNLLKRIQIEQKVDTIKKSIENLADKINDIKNKTDNANLSDKSKRDELSDRQKDITKDIAELKDEMKKLGDQMNGVKDMPKNEMDNIQKDFEKDQNKELSESAEHDLEKQQKQNAGKEQNQLSQNIAKLGKQMSGMQSSMQQMNQVKTFYDLMKIMEDLLSLSKEEEKLKNSTEQLSPYSQDFNKNSREQNDIKNGLGKVMQKMSDLSQKTFAITPEMGKSLGEALSEMQQSMNSMQNKKGPQASQNQKNAMAALNGAASMIKGGMEQMMNGGKGSGMMTMMQQLQQMAQQQMTLNKMTQVLNQGEMSQEMMSQMERLAQQQEMIRKSLEQLNQEAKESGQSKRLASNLEKILNEMKEVVSNLQSEKVNNELIKKQDKILTKLLDAQRSVNDRDFENDRKSESGKNLTGSSPSELILNGKDDKNKLREELMKSFKEGYKKDYEDLIRKYFEALEKEK